MIYIEENNLANFHFWAGGKANAEKLTWDELDQLDKILDVYGLWGEEPPKSADINDLFWFDFDFVCEQLGYKYDIDNDKVIR